MAAVAFYVVLTALALSAIALEWWVDRRGQRGWHHLPDTLANVNLAAGNLVLGTLLAAMVLWGIDQAHAWRVVDVNAVPWFIALPIGFLLTEFCQYWQHRLSHRWPLLAWGHLTHHSSSHFNLSTAVRVNWLYRAYAWLFYLPLPLLGFTVEQFVLFQGLINVYNLYCHTRADVPAWEALSGVLVTPRVHQLHHTSDPRCFGNYGACLVIWDRVFGTYRRLPEGLSADALPYGMGANVDTASPWALNTAHLADVAATRRARGGSWGRWLLSEEALEAAPRPGLATSVGVGALAAVAVAVVVALTVQLVHQGLGLGPHLALVALGVGAVGAAGRSLAPRTVQVKLT